MSLREPLRFAPRAVQKVWGGSFIASRWAEFSSDAEPVGEAWFLYDRPGCSAVVALGAFEGRTLSGLMLSEREALLGTSNAALDDAFPLMIKWLDTREALSVQVHPNEEDARRLGVQPKDECWYVLSAEPGSLIHLGLKGGVDASAFAALEGAPDIVDLLQSPCWQSVLGRRGFG